VPTTSKNLLLLLLISALSATSAVKSQEPQRKDTPDGDYSAELPRIPPTEPADALKKFTLAPGFRIELVASEPNLASPVAMAFDEAWRIYVVEMRDYSEQDKEHLGRIRLLEDKDGDGVYESASIYAENLSWPTAILCYDGGVFVGAAPDILFLKDTDGDGRINNADPAEKRVIFTGFGRSNVQGLMNSFQWGPDNRVYVAVSSSGAQLKKPGVEEILLDLRGRDFAFDPRTRRCESIAGGAQHGMTFTKWGERLVCSNSDHLQWIAYDDSHAAKNPFLPAPPARVSIAADGPQAEVFRTSPVEPWRVVRTRLRATGVVPGLVEGGGRASGYFTSATGVTAVTGTAFPPVPGDPDGEWIVVGDVGSNLVHRKKLFLENGMLRGARVDEKSELLTSSDNWFRPVQFANAPDGALYILDMYREVIEHPASLPPAIKKHLDLTSGRDRGRIWRLVKEDFKRPRARDLGKLTTPELIACLSDANTWTRVTAQRLLFERQKYLEARDEIANALRDPSAIERLPPIALFHRLQILAAIPDDETPADLRGRLPIALVNACLESPNPNLRLAAARICEKQVHLKLVAPLIKLLEDKNPLIRRSAAFALGQVDAALVMPSLAKLARRDEKDAFTRYAIAWGLKEEPGIFLAELMRDEKFANSPARTEWIKSLGAALSANLAASQSERSDIQRQVGPLGHDFKHPSRPSGSMTAVQQSDNIDAACALLKSLFKKDQLLAGELMIALSPAEGSELAARLHEATDGESGSFLQTYLEVVRGIVMDKQHAIKTRAKWVEQLRLSTFVDEKKWLGELFAIDAAPELQLAAIDLLGAYRDEAVAPWVIERWPTMTPMIRDRASQVLISRSAWIGALFIALERKDILSQDVPASARTILAQHPDENIRRRAQDFFVGTTSREKEQIMAVYQERLSGGGDVAKGKAHFAKHCSACHQLEGVGNATGPNLATMKARGAEVILTNVVDPNREVLPQYQSYVAETTDGRVLSGMIESESPTTIVLRKADGQKEELLRSKIESLRSTGQSLMPEGLEKQLDQAAMADLLAYLMKAE
jgi:putative membrane-bound dehydrogenase-like protein